MRVTVAVPNNAIDILLPAEQSRLVSQVRIDRDL